MQLRSVGSPVRALLWSACFALGAASALASEAVSPPAPGVVAEPAGTGGTSSAPVAEKAVAPVPSAAQSAVSAPAAVESTKPAPAAVKQDKPAADASKAATAAAKPAKTAARNAAAKACPFPVAPGRGIGALRIGMTLEEVQALGKVTAPKATKQPSKDPAWHSVTLDGRPLRFALGLDQRVNEISMCESKVCLDDGGPETAIFDMRGPTAQAHAPLLGCSLEAAAHRAAWNCEHQGMVFAWEKGATVVYVQPVVRDEIDLEPPPVPPWFARLPGCAKVRHPKLACGFFGGNETLECYPTTSCMGIFSKESAANVTLFTAEGERVGPFKWSRYGWSLAHKFETPPAPGTQFRVFFNRRVGGTVGHTAQDQVRTRRSLVAVRSAHEFPDGFVLNVEAPRPEEDMSSQCRYFGGDQCFKTVEEACAAQRCGRGKCRVGKGDPAEVTCKE